MSNKYPWLLECLQKDRIWLEYIPTASMNADGMTKQLERMKHVQPCRDLGLQGIIRPETAQLEDTTQTDKDTNHPRVQGVC